MNTVTCTQFLVCRLSGVGDFEAAKTSKVNKYIGPAKLILYIVTTPIRMVSKMDDSRLLKSFPLNRPMIRTVISVSCNVQARSITTLLEGIRRLKVGLLTA